MYLSMGKQVQTVQLTTRIHNYSELPKSGRSMVMGWYFGKQVMPRMCTYSISHVTQFLMSLLFRYYLYVSAKCKANTARCQSLIFNPSYDRSSPASANTQALISGTPRHILHRCAHNAGPEMQSHTFFLLKFCHVSERLAS